MITHEQFKEALRVVDEYKAQLKDAYKKVENETSNFSKFFNVSRETKIMDTDVSVRVLNQLRFNKDILGIDAYSTVNDLSKISIKKFLSLRNTGKKSLKELKELCYYANVNMLP